MAGGDPNSLNGKPYFGFHRAQQSILPREAIKIIHWREAHKAELG